MAGNMLSYKFISGTYAELRIYVIIITVPSRILVILK